MLVKKNRIGPIHPGILMALFWLAIVLVYVWGPIYLTPKVSITTCLFLLVHIVLFILGASVFSKIVFFRSLWSKTKYTPYISMTLVYKLALIVLTLGVCGGGLSIYKQLSALEIINLSSITALRELKAQALLTGSSMTGGYLSAIAFLTYPAGFVGMVIGIICFEEITGLLKTMLYVFIGMIVFLAISYGGRSPILVLFLLMGLACYIRTFLSKSFFPKVFALRLALFFLLVLFLVYSSFIWVLRIQNEGGTTSAKLLYAENVWGAHPKDYLLRASQKLGSPGFAQTVLSSTFYLIQSLSISERLLSSSKPMPHLYGAYQIDLFAALLRNLPGGAAFLENRYGVLLDANVYGFFTGAWTGLYIDFGFFSLFAVLIWGYCAGKSWIEFKRDPNALTGIKYIFWTYTIFISFVSYPLGFSNSLMLFFWFLFFSVFSLFFIRVKSNDGFLQLF